MKNAILLSLLLFAFNSIQAQYEINPVEGYTPQIGAMVSMLENLKQRIEEQVKDLNQEQVDYLFDENANSIGALIMHLVATELYYLAETLEDGSWTEEEKQLLGAAGGLGEAARKKYTGKPISYYLEQWDQVRKRSLEGLKKKDDDWFAADIDDGINNHFAWFHVMEHSANHMGQIALVKNRLPK